MTPWDAPDLRRAQGESRAQRLGSALQGLAADVVNERQKVAELRRSVAELTSRLDAAQGTQSRDQAQPLGLLQACPPWAHWNGELERRYTLGVEEELMLLEPESCALAQSSDRVLARFSDELLLHASPETHAAVIELRTGILTNVGEVVGELAGLRGRLAHELGEMGLSAAAAGTYPLRTREQTVVSGAARYRLLGDSLRSLAHREPTMALHVHVGVPNPEDAIRLLNGLRRSVPVLLALSANSRFSQGRDGGFDSVRTVILQAFPRTGLPRSFAGYADYVGALDAVIGPGAVTDPSFFWWDVRPQPKLGTVEVRVMDAQSTLAEVTPLVALIQSLSRLELEGDPPQLAPSAEVLAENRFMAARDGMAARLIEPATGRLVSGTSDARHDARQVSPARPGVGVRERARTGPGARRLQRRPPSAHAHGRERRPGASGPQPQGPIPHSGMVPVHGRNITADTTDNTNERGGSCAAGSHTRDLRSSSKKRSIPRPTP